MLTLDTGDTRLIIDRSKAHGLLRNQAAYVLATVLHETARTMKPVREAFWLSDDWRRRNLRYWPYYGRGYVQLTWERNYRLAGEKLGKPLVESPDLALDPEIAVDVLVIGCRDGWFTGAKLADYITLQKSDWKEARRVVNGTDKADTIAGFAADYDDALLKLDRYGVDPVDMPDVPLEQALALLARARADITAAEALLGKGPT